LKVSAVKPTCRRAHSVAVWTNARVRITNKVWSFRDYYRLQIRIVEREYWRKRHVAVNAANPRELPSAEPPSASKGQFIHNVPDEIVPNVESRTTSASLAIENILRLWFIDSFYQKSVRSIIHRMTQRIKDLPGKIISVLS